MLGCQFDSGRAHHRSLVADVLRCQLRALDDRVAFVVERYGKFDRIAADRTIFDEFLASTTARIDGDVVELRAPWAGIGGIAFQWHAPSFPARRRRTRLGIAGGHAIWYTPRRNGPRVRLFHVGPHVR